MLLKFSHYVYGPINICKVHYNLSIMSIWQSLIDKCEVEVGQTHGGKFHFNIMNHLLSLFLNCNF